MGARTDRRRRFTVAAIGCTGPMSAVFMNEFTRLGLDVRLLARDPERAATRFPGVRIVPGSMMNADDAAVAMRGADAAFLVTPLGARGDMTAEIEAANVAVTAAATAGLPHLIYVSVIGIESGLTGVPALDAKRHVEAILGASGIPWTSIRCGSYMEDVIDKRLALVARRGIFVLPVARDRRFSFTCQRDVPRLVARLLSDGQALNRPVDLIDPTAHTPADVARLLARRCGRKVTATGRWPLYYLLLLAQPFYWWRRRRMSGVVPLLSYFNRHGYTGDPHQMRDILPGFRVTTLEEHLRPGNFPIPATGMPALNVVHGLRQFLAHQREHRLVAGNRSVGRLLVPGIALAAVGGVAESLVQGACPGVAVLNAEFRLVQPAGADSLLGGLDKQGADTA